MAWYACMKARYDFIEHLLLLTLVLLLSLLGILPFLFRETVLFIDHSPNCWPVVVCKRLYILVQIKVLSFSVFVILHVPWPTHFIILCLLLILFFRPSNLLWRFLHLIRFYPVCWNVFGVASTHCAAFRPANFIPYIQLTLLV